jgi:hypothetical protein
MYTLCFPSFDNMICDLSPSFSIVDIRLLYPIRFFVLFVGPSFYYLFISCFRSLGPLLQASASFAEDSLFSSHFLWSRSQDHTYHLFVRFLEEDYV